MSRQHFTEQLEHVELQPVDGELPRAPSSARSRHSCATTTRWPSAWSTTTTDLAIDSGVLEMLAPIARRDQLRLVSAILHSCLHLERIGDQAVNIAKLYLATRDLPPSQTLLQQLDDMGTHVVTMIRTAMEAFRSRDLELCIMPQDGRPRGPARATHLEALKLADDPVCWTGGCT